MKKALLFVFGCLITFSSLHAQWTPDIATLNYKTGLNQDTCSIRALEAIRIIPNELYHNEFLIFVPERLDRRHLRKEFFNLSRLERVKPLIERVNDNVYRISKIGLPIGEYAVHFQYKDDVRVHRLRVIQ
jgi:hypothetical protein